MVASVVGECGADAPEKEKPACGFVLHDIQGYEHNEIAGIVGCSIGNSKSQLHNARMKLRDLLKMNRAEKAETS